MVSEHFVDYHSILSGLISRIHPHISINPLGLYISPEYLLDFLSYHYIPSWLGKFFKFISFSLQENVFASQKIECRHFFLMLPGKTIRQILIIYQHCCSVLFENLFPPAWGTMQYLQMAVIKDIEVTHLSLKNQFFLQRCYQCLTFKTK